MAKLTAEQIQALADELANVAAVFSPQSALAIKGLLAAGTELNALIHKVRTQTEENAPEVWAEVQKDYADSVDAFQKSVDLHA